MSHPTSSGQLQHKDASISIKEMIYMPILYGNYAIPIQKDKVVEGATHKWTVYVRPYHLNRCLSPWIKEVVFVLHNSFRDYRRVVKEPPYCVTETGWGEFEIFIEIHFHDHSNEPPVLLSHLLRLFLDHQPKNEKLTKKPIITEQHEELIFVNPNQYLRTQLLTNKRPQSTHSHATQGHQDRATMNPAISIHQSIPDISLLLQQYTTSHLQLYEYNTIQAIKDSQRVVREQTNHLFTQIQALRHQVEVLQHVDQYLRRPHVSADQNAANTPSDSNTAPSQGQ